MHALLLEMIQRVYTRSHEKMADIFADDIFKGICTNQNHSILIKISLNFVPKIPIDDISVVVQVMAFHQKGNRPLPEPMLT